MSQNPSPQSWRDLDSRYHFLDQMKCFPKRRTRLSHPRHSCQISHLVLPNYGGKYRRCQDVLGKIRHASDDKKWRLRGDQILRDDYISRQKRWEEDQAKSAPELPITPDDDEEEARLQSYVETEGTEIIDNMLLIEEQEFDALVSLRQGPNSEAEQIGSRTTDYETVDEDEECIWLHMEAGSASEAWEVRAVDSPELSREIRGEMDMSPG